MTDLELRRKRERAEYLLIKLDSLISTYNASTWELVDGLEDARSFIEDYLEEIK